MAFKISVGPGVKNLSRKFEEKLRKEAAFELERRLEEAIGEIVTRTQSGKGVNGEPLKPYTREWRNIKNGLTPSGKPTSKLTKRRRNRRSSGIQARGDTVNLTYTAKMLQSIRAKVSSTADKLIGRLFFLPSQAGKAKGNHEKRPFFGLSDSQIAKIMAAIKEKLA